jgi:hypothetical protein
VSASPKSLDTKTLADSGEGTDVFEYGHIIAANLAGLYWHMIGLFGR